MTDPARWRLADPRTTGAVARGARRRTGRSALVRVARAADFLAAQVAREEPIYGVSTGFGSNADKLLGAHPLRDELPVRNAKSGQSLHRSNCSTT
jgi:histidine ammonia-lyase